jgi:hypothetical protein
MCWRKASRCRQRLRKDVDLAVLPVFTPSSQYSLAATIPSPQTDAQLDRGLAKFLSVTPKFDPHSLRSAWNMATS